LSRPFDISGVEYAWNRYLVNLLTETSMARCEKRDITGRTYDTDAFPLGDAQPVSQAAGPQLVWVPYRFGTRNRDRWFDCLPITRDRLLHISMAINVLHEQPCIPNYTAACPDMRKDPDGSADVHVERDMLSFPRKNTSGLFFDTVLGTTHIMTLQDLHETADLDSTKIAKEKKTTTQSIPQLLASEHKGRPYRSLDVFRKGEFAVEEDDVVLGILRRIGKYWREQGQEVTVSLHKARSAS